MTKHALTLRQQTWIHPLMGGFVPTNAKKNLTNTRHSVEVQTHAVVREFKQIATAGSTMVGESKS